MEVLRRNALRSGVILGILLIVFNAVIYAVNLELFTKWWLGLFSFLAIIVIGCATAVRAKRQNGGYLTFKNTFTVFFITLAVGLSISTVFSIVLFNVIDPDAKQFLSESIIKSTSKMMQNFGAPAADVNKMIHEMQKQDSFGPLQQLQGLLMQIVIYSIIGLIASAVIKKDPPQAI